MRCGGSTRLSPPIAAPSSSSPTYADAWANLGTTLHHSGDFDEGIVRAAPRHRAGAASRQRPFRARHPVADARRFRRRLGRIRMAAALDRAQRPALSGKVPGRAKASPASTSTSRPSRVSATRCNSRATLPLLAARAGKVTLRVHQQLVTLLRESFPGITVLGDRGDPAPYHCDAVLLSLPRLFKTRLETIPADVPYLRAPPEAAQRWKKRLGNDGGPQDRRGLGGQSRARQRSSPLDRPRRCSRRCFAVPGTSFASLQFGPRAADLQKSKAQAQHRDRGSCRRS